MGLVFIHVLDCKSDAVTLSGYNILMTNYFDIE